MAWFARIVRSYFSLPVWVIVWISLFLVPANFAAFAFLDTISGLWIALLGAGAIIINLPLVWLNGGFSKVLCIPHVLFWTPLVAFLGYRLASADLGTGEFMLTLMAFIINGISLFFDYYDLKQWRNGNRQVAGFEADAVRF